MPPPNPKPWLIGIDHGPAGFVIARVAHHVRPVVAFSDAAVGAAGGRVQRDEHGYAEALEYEPCIAAAARQILRECCPGYADPATPWGPG